MLGKVESKQPVQGIPISSIVLPQLPLSWSDDNNIALTSQLGLYIFVLHLSPNGDHPGVLLFDRFFISPPDHPNPFILSGPPLLALVKGLDKAESHALMLDVTLSAAHRASIELALHRSHKNPGVGQGMGGDVSHNGFRKGVWSPNGLSQQGCLFCLVTYDHQISIVGQKGMQWVTLSDLTPIWHRYLTKDNKQLLVEFQRTVGNLPHHKFIAETKMLGVADFVWTPLVTERKATDVFSYILMVSTSMHLAVWKIPYYNETLQPQIVQIFCLKNCEERITNICYHCITSQEGTEGYIFVGTVRGDIYIYFISIQKEETAISFISSLPNASPGMSVSHLNLLPLEDVDYYVLFCSKNNVFFGFLLNLTPMSCTVGSSTYAFTGCLNISGIKVVNPHVVYISSKDGNIKEYNVEIDTDALSIYISKKKLILASDNVNYDGFCTSPHKSFWAILETASSSYDHLILREPSVVNIFQVNSLETICAYLKSNSDVPVAKHVDLFESVRLLHQGKNSNLLLAKEQEISSFDFHHKVTYLWFAEILLSSQEDVGIEKEEIEKIRTLLLDNILKDHICDVLSAINQESLSTNPQYRHSLFLMCSFLQKIKASHPNFKRVVAQLKKAGENGEEKCLICGKIVKFQSVITAKCSLGHTMPRCLRTLLPTIPTLKCRHCDIFFLPEAKNWYKDGDTCVFCCSILKSKNRKRKIDNQNGSVKSVIRASKATKPSKRNSSSRKSK